jgi:DNA gyrase subunit A
MGEASRLLNVSIEDEMKNAFMDYAMSVIISRALPDARDGLKPVHRRILYTMHRLRNFHNQPYMKSARVVGETMGKLHPHGDAAIYDAMVRMAQDFSMRAPLADGQGNFGSVDGDPPAAMRYTEVRMERLAGEMLADIEKETVEFVPNYDDKDQEPTVLPTRFPNLLINGSSGIAVGMATSVPPHNLKEIIDATIALVRDPEVTTRQLMEHIPGPDFPTAGLIHGRSGIFSAYETGRGNVVMRARADIEEMAGGKSRIVVTEIPYMVNKARLLEKIAELVKEKRIEHISDVRDESDRRGMRVVITLRKDAPAEVVLNRLYKLSPLQTSFNTNLIAIVDGRPRLLTLKAALSVFVRHRRAVVTRRTQFELGQALDRREVVEGLGVACVDIDAVVSLIRESKDPAQAERRLTEYDFAGFAPFLKRAGRPRVEINAAVAEAPYHLTQRQAKAILDMRLQRLTGLQQEKLAQEYSELCDEIRRLREILGDDEKLKELIISELDEIRETFAQPRRTEILEETGELTVEDLIADEEMVVTMTLSGYVKRTALAGFRAQQRGGKGRRGAKVRAEDELATMFVARSHSHVLLFTDKGRVFKKVVYEFPAGSPYSRGKALVNFLELQPEEKVVQMLPVREFEQEQYVLMATSRGIVKKTELMAFANIRATGIIALVLEEGDRLIETRLTDGNKEVLLGTAMGQGIRFPESQVRPMGRVSRGVKGITLRSGDHLVSMSTVVSDSTTFGLTVSERGYGKLTPVSGFPTRNRGGVGVKTAPLSHRVGDVVALRVVDTDDHVMMVTTRGNVIRIPANTISVMGRVTQGVTLVKLPEDDSVMAVVTVPRGDAAERNQHDESSLPEPGNGETNHQEEEPGNGETNGQADEPGENHSGAP